MIAPSRESAAFTLIEVMLVIVILAMLAGLSIMAYSGIQERARLDTTRTLVENIVPDALERYKLLVGHYPTEAEGGLEALRTKPDFGDNEEAAKKWLPCLTKEPKDAWGKKLTYEVVEGDDTTGKKYKLASAGPDGQPDTEDDIKYPAQAESGI